jgi:hypothetical protein
VASFSDKIHDGPTFLTTLKVVETEVSQFSSSNTTAQQDSNNRAVPFAFERLHVR